MSNSAERLDGKILCAKEWLARPPSEPIIPVVNDLFDLGDKVCIIGGSKMRKTWCVSQLAASLAMGIPFLHWKIPSPRRVLLIQLEVKAARFHQRLEDVCKSLETEPPDNLYVVNGRGLNLTSEDIICAAKKTQAEVIIVDPLYKLVEGDENRAEDMGKLLKQFDRIVETTGAALIYTHHDSKGIAGQRDIQDRGAGSNVLGRDYDTCITLTPHSQGEPLQVLDTIKRNYPPQKAVSVEFDPCCFKVSLAPAIPQTRQNGNGNPTTNMPLGDFLYSVTECVENAPDASINKGALVAAIRAETDLTKQRSEQLIELAMDKREIVSNNGKGLRRKKVLYALNEDDLQSEIHRINNAV